MTWLGDFFAEHWGDVASVVGMGIAIVTLIAASRSRDAALKAARAVADVKSQLARVDTAGQLSMALAIMDEITRHHRSKSWHLLPDRYAVAKRLLVAVRESSTGLTDEQVRLLTESINQLGVMERSIERKLSGEEYEPSGVDMNGILSDQSVALVTLQSALKNQIGRDVNG